jgi:hypothetical protein
MRMSKFVNFNKRSIKLPPGCKDLIDLLNPKIRRKLQGAIAPEQLDELPALTRDESVLGTLAEIENRISMAYETQATIFILAMSPPEGRPVLQVYGRKGEMLSASLGFPKDAKWEQEVRSFCNRHNLKIPEEPEMPAAFHPDLPWSLVYPIIPASPEAPPLSIIAKDFFRELCGLENRSQMKFDHIEIASAA